MAPHWEGVENTYVGGSKIVFRKIREERENIIRYYFQIRYVMLPSYLMSNETSIRQNFILLLINFMRNIYQVFLNQLS